MTTRIDGNKSINRPTKPPYTLQSGKVYGDFVLFYMVVFVSTNIICKYSLQMFHPFTVC